MQALSVFVSPFRIELDVITLTFFFGILFFK